MATADRPGSAAGRHGVAGPGSAGGQGAAERAGGAEPAAAAESLGSIGELEALRRIFPRLPRAHATLLGPGDDAAVIAAADGRFVATTDMMVHGPDFRLAWSTPFDLGWKAAASNLADIAAMGATPSALLVALAAPVSTDVGFLERFADGLREACVAMAPGCGVVGGDLSVADAVTIAVTAFGDLRGRPPVLRSGAQPGDIVAVAGELGLAAAGIRLLFEHAVDELGEPSADRLESLRERFPRELEAQFRPRPPIAAGEQAAVAGATAMLDVSDGLVIDARRIARASGVAIDVDSSAVGSADALHGGEDHALLATFPAGAALPAAFRAIGGVEASAPGRPEGLYVDGVRHDERGGWDPYADWNGRAG